jgi:hypothetical protein
LYQTLEASNFGCLWGIWVCGTIIVTLRGVSKHLAYARHFPFWRHNIVLWQRQADPTLEELRWATWRSYGMVLCWLLGVPLLTIGAVHLIDASGFLLAP